MPYRNDQLVGCLPDDDLDDLLNLPVPDTNPHQFNQLNLNTNQCIVDSHLQTNQTRSNELATELSNQLDSRSSRQFLDNNTSTTFNFQSDYDNQLDQLTNQLADQSTATNFNSNLDIFDIDELELNHLKDLENLMDTTQLQNQQPTNQLNSNQLSPNQLNVNQLNANQLTTNQLSPNQLNPVRLSTSQLSPNQLNASQLNRLNANQLSNQLNTSQINQQVVINNSQASQLNQAQSTTPQFLTSTSHPTYDNRLFNSSNATSAQTNSSVRRTTTSIQANQSTNENSFLAAVNSRQVNNSACNNFLKSTSTFAPANFSSQLTSNNTPSELGAFCDQIVNSNLNQSNLALNATRLPDSSTGNQLVGSQLKDTFYQDQVFCAQDTELQATTSSTMLNSDLQNSNLLSSNCYAQPAQFGGQLINSPNQLLTSSTNPYTNSSNLQTTNLQSSNLQTAMINSNPSTPVKHLPQFKSSNLSGCLSSPTNNNLSKVRSPSNEWLDTVANQLAQDMERCGICVIDSFLGESFCNTILDEVIEMYGDGYFKDGLLVGNKQNGDKNIRGDKIHWVEGKESNCQNIGYLMRTLDQILMRFSRLNVGGCQSIQNRTKAMIACYEYGTKYVKHVDNPNNDGRYITCIYYLNKRWNSKRDGGTLRIFPKNMPYVANIEPLFDRVIFFWSDRRNPHEVMPAYSIRFAITLWYFNSKEREQYIKKMQSLQQPAQS